MYELDVQGTKIKLSYKDNKDYISLTDIAKYKDKGRTDYIIQNWLRIRSTIEFVGLWEKIHNPTFKPVEFDGFRNAAGSNSFSLTAKKWIKRTNAIGIYSMSGRYGGTYAHKDIAFEFASWISAEFKLYFIKEFQRLKENEQKSKNLEWDIKRDLARINYKIHTDAIKENLLPPKILKKQERKIYADEADVLNVALFGKTAKEWRQHNKGKKGNIRDYANITQLICLSNLENLNSFFIKEGIEQSKRLCRLNEIAIDQMKRLVVKNKFLMK